MTVLGQKSLASRGLQTLFTHGALGGLSDAQLLDRFVTDRDEAVFGLIVERHGAMVWGVCRRVLRDHHDAEDAFQATFLVLARRAAAIMPREKLGNWLHGVAYQTALKARAKAFQRRVHEKQVMDMPETGGVCAGTRDDRLDLLDHEIHRLPQKYRAPIILCELEGKTHGQAAELLGWPIGTVSGRLSRARSILAKRLRGRTGEAWPMVSASASAPVSLIRSTIKAASGFAAGQTAGVVSTRVAILTEGVLKVMFMTKLKVATAVVVMAALGTTGVKSFSITREADASNPAQAHSAPGRKDAERRAAVDTRDEMKKFEAMWAITGMVNEGVPATEAEKMKGLGRCVIKGDKIAFKTPPEGKGACFSFVVDPSKTPKLISLFTLNEKLEENPNDPILLGIYELKNDTLTIAFGIDRPANIELPPQSKQYRIVLKWARPLRDGD
jgi:RNA polymerase sigma-70 factor (ECF subfamily)